MTMQAKLPRKTVLQIAAKTGSDPRTVERVAAGKPVKPPSLARIIPALKAAGLMVAILAIGCSAEGTTAKTEATDTKGPGRGTTAVIVADADVQPVSPSPDAGIPPQDVRPALSPDASPASSPDTLPAADTSPIQSPDTKPFAADIAPADGRIATVVILPDAHAYPDVGGWDGPGVEWCWKVTGFEIETIYGGAPCKGKFNGGSNLCASDCYNVKTTQKIPARTDPDQTIQTTYAARSIDNTQPCRLERAATAYPAAFVDAFGATVGNAVCVPHGQCDVYCR